MRAVEDLGRGRGKFTPHCPDATLKSPCIVELSAYNLGRGEVLLYMFLYFFHSFMMLYRLIPLISDLKNFIFSWLLDPVPLLASDKSAQNWEFNVVPDWFDF